MGAKGENLIMFVPPKLLTRLTEKQTHFIHWIWDLKTCIWTEPSVVYFFYFSFFSFFLKLCKKTCMTKNDLNVSSIIHSFASFGKKTKTNYNNSSNCEHIFESLWGRLLNAHLKYETNSDICKFGLFKQRRAALKKDDERVWKSLVNRKITIEISQLTMISATAPIKKNQCITVGWLFCLVIRYTFVS